jgi:hypothetical protein
MAGKLVIVALLGVTTAGCDDRPDQWDAYIYSPSDDGSINEFTIKGFKSFELCQAAAQGELLRHGRGEGQDYECGYKCGPLAEYGGLNVCEETRK